MTDMVVAHQVFRARLSFGLKRLPQATIAYRLYSALRRASTRRLVHDHRQGDRSLSCADYRVGPVKSVAFEFGRLNAYGVAFGG